jgi:hypothetical protein
LKNFIKELEVFKGISFLEEAHRYFINGTPSNDLSVTRLIKKFKREFKQQEMASRVAKKTGKTEQQVLAEWETNRLYSSTLGTILHKYVESFYKKSSFNLDVSYEGLGFDEKQKLKTNLPILVEYFQTFYKENKHLECLKNEFVIGDLEDTKVCGTADMLCINQKTSMLEILDFKTNKKISRSSMFAKLFYPFDDMDECEFNEYTIQLNTYKYFIEKYTNIVVGDMKLIWLQATNNNYKIISLPNIQEKITLMFERFKAISLFEEL